MLSHPFAQFSFLHKEWEDVANDNLLLLSKEKLEQETVLVELKDLMQKTEPHDKEEARQRFLQMSFTKNIKAD